MSSPYICYSIFLYRIYFVDIQCQAKNIKHLLSIVHSDIRNKSLKTGGDIFLFWSHLLLPSLHELNKQGKNMASWSDDNSIEDRIVDRIDKLQADMLEQLDFMNEVAVQLNLTNTDRYRNIF